jgi:DNA-directed RNA polymerase subunit RPC12/RpoP
MYRNHRNHNDDDARETGTGKNLPVIVSTRRVFAAFDLSRCSIRYGVAGETLDTQDMEVMWTKRPKWQFSSYHFRAIHRLLLPADDASFSDTSNREEVGQKSMARARKTDRLMTRIGVRCRRCSVAILEWPLTESNEIQGCACTAGESKRCSGSTGSSGVDDAGRRYRLLLTQIRCKRCSITPLGGPPILGAMNYRINVDHARAAALRFARLLHSDASSNDSW